MRYNEIINEAMHRLRLGIMIEERIGAINWEPIHAGSTTFESGFGGAGYMLTMPDGNRIFLDATVERAFSGYQTIFLSQIAIEQKASGLGRKVMNTIRDLADENDWDIAVYKVTNPDFFRSFDWLTEKNGDFNYRQTR